jgi:hypothetical protein
MRKSLREVFPYAQVLGDSFHFMQACLRWLRVNQQKEIIPEFKTQLNILWSSPTAQEWDTNWKLFRTLWKTNNPLFLDYFQSNWISKTHPKNWAFCFRTNANLPSGKF